MRSQISFCGYVCPSIYSISGRILWRLDFSKTFQPLFNQEKPKVFIVFKRSIAALLILLATTADCLIFFGKGIYLIAKRAPIGIQKNNFVNIISSIALSILVLTMPFGFLPQINLRRHPNFESERLRARSELEEMEQQLRKGMKERWEKRYQSLKNANDHSQIFTEFFEKAHQFDFEVREEHIQDIYKALMAGVDPSQLIDGKMPLVTMLTHRVFRDPASLHPTRNLTIEVSRYIRIAKMLIYAGCRLEPALSEHQGITPEIRKMVEDFYNQMQLEIETERKAFTENCSTQTDLRALPLPVVQLFGGYWLPPFEKFLTPQTPGLNLN